MMFGELGMLMQISFRVLCESYSQVIHRGCTISIVDRKYGAIIEHHQTNIGGFDFWGHEYKENINYQPVVK